MNPAKITGRKDRGIVRTQDGQKLHSVSASQFRADGRLPVSARTTCGSRAAGMVEQLSINADQVGILCRRCFGYGKDREIRRGHLEAALFADYGGITIKRSETPLTAWIPWAAWRGAQLFASSEGKGERVPFQFDATRFWLRFDGRSAYQWHTLGWDRGRKLRKSPRYRSRMTRQKVS